MKDQKYHFLKIMFRGIPMYVKHAPLFVLVSQLVNVIHALFWTLGIMATQWLFDSISQASEHQRGFWGVVTYIGLLGIATFGQQILNGLANFLNEQIDLISVRKETTQLQHQLQRLPAIYFEDPAFLDDINKAKAGIKAFAGVISSAMNLFTFYGVYFGSVIWYLFGFSPFLPWVILLSFIPALLSQIVRSRSFNHLEKEQAIWRRKQTYYQQAICDRPHFKETRLLGAFSYFYEKFEETLALVMTQTWKTEKGMAYLELGLNIMALIGLGGSIYSIVRFCHGW